MQIVLNLQGHRLLAGIRQTLSSGSKEVDEIKLEVDETWKGFGKIAVFCVGKKCQYTVVDEVTQTAKIPAEILKNEAVITIGMVGFKDEAVMTSTLVAYQVEKGSVVTIEEPKPSIYAEILSRYADLATRLNNIIANAGDLTNNAELIDARVGADGVVYDTLGEAIRGVTGQLSEEIGNIVSVEIGKNIIPNIWEIGYVDSVSGDLDNSQTSAMRSKKIKVRGGENIIKMLSSSYETRLSAMNIYQYKKDGSYIGFLSVNETTPKTLNSETYSIIVASKNNLINKETYSLIGDCTGYAYSDSPVSFEEYKRILSINNNVLIQKNIEERIKALEKSSNIVVQISVGVGKQYSSLVDAINSITDSSESKQYIINLYEGEYETVVENNINSDYKGLIIPDYVSIIGVGDREKIIIKGTLPSLEYSEFANKISTINLTMNGTVENVTIKSKNIKYCNHDDGSEFGMIDAAHSFRLVKFIVEKTDDGISASSNNIGIGSQKNKEIIFEMCEFINYNQGKTAILAHDNASVAQTRGCRLTVKKCIFNLTEESEDIRLSNSGGNMECYAYITENFFKSSIVISSLNELITTNVWKIFVSNNNKYTLVKKSGMAEIDLAESITDFNNGN